MTTVTSTMPEHNKNWEPMDKLFITSGKPLDLSKKSYKFRSVKEDDD